MANRKYKLYIGYVKELDDKSNNRLAGVGANTKTIDMQSIPTDNNFLLIDDLQMTATIAFPKEGTSSKNPQQTIVVMNPSQESIHHIRRRSNVVLLNAGFDDDVDLPMICATQIVKSSLEQKGIDTVLTLVCAEAYKVKRNIRISKSYSATMTYKEVIDDILNEFAGYGISSVSQLEGLQDKQLGKSRVFNDSLTEALDDICNSINYRWNMACSVIYVEPRNKSIEKNQAIRVLSINQENLKGEIVEIQDTSNKNSSESKDNGKGVKFKINLNGNLNKGDAVRITFGDYAGAYLITSVKHSLDFEGSAWDTEVECKR